MEIDIDRQKEAQQKAKTLLAEEEQKRAERRLIQLLANLEEGNIDVLLNDELMEKLPAIISDYCQVGDRDKARILFEKLGESACNENKNIRERAVMALSFCYGGLKEKQHADLLEDVSSILLRWLRVETKFLSACDIVCRQLQKSAIRMLEEGLWRQCYNLLEVFYQIQSGSLKKSNAIRSVVCRAQDGIAADYILEELTLVTLRGRGDRRQQAEKLITHLGRKAATHLLDTLLNCKEKSDRLRLVGLIPATGNVSVSVLKEYLQKSLPWYGIRNIILMITAMDDQELVPLIMPFLSHEDIRIQQQVLDCITEVVSSSKIGGYLLAALPIVDDALKIELVTYIGLLGEREANDAFLDLLGQRDSFADEVHDELLQKLSVHVRLSNSIRAVNLLNMVVEERSSQYDPKTDPVLLAVNQSLQILKPRFNLDEKGKKKEQSDAINEASTQPEDVDVSFDGDPSKKNAAHQKVHSINEKITKLLGQKKVEEAGKYLYKKCVAAAEEKDFETATMLRDRILEVDPNALAEVIQAGEKIEEERSSAVTSSHITIWQDIYDSLTTDEFNALYYALEAREYETGAVIIEQGVISPELYFINSGEVRLSCWRDKDEIFLKRIGPGEIIGAGPFFDVSVWTVSLTALSKTTIHLLKREKFLELIEQYPAIEPCLHDYCRKSDTVPELLRMSGEDRRRSVRYPLSLIVKHALLDKFGNASMKSFKGEIADLSSSGLSFYIRISRKENARLMLGRGIKTLLPIPGQVALTIVGQIVAVKFQQYGESDYSVHVQFNEPISENIVKRIVQ
jgi:CRP-like cAMP-binding protein